ncbi:hypothetical protein MMC22_000790 [Lobaria immixta]|nr:hypothetical protein [Lobaria immixta]
MAALSEASTDSGHDENAFAPIIASIRLDRLPLFATSVRKLEQKPIKLETESSNSMDCFILSPPLVGSFHILFRIKFGDGAQWVLKVPATGHPDRFDGSDAKALTSEALTMRLIKRETTVPIPEVYSFNASTHNDLGCPFILMEYIEGVSLYEFWFEEKSSKAVMEQRRARLLQDLAAVVVQLNQFAYRQGGRLLFDEEGNPTSVGPMRKLDVSSMLDRQQTGDLDESFIFCELGPFTDSKAFLLCMLDRRLPPPDQFGQGIYKLLRLFIDWFPSADYALEPEFVLSHPDLDFQNILVTPEGGLRGIIDWDGVGTVPRCVGNERYPSWLTRDWDPAKYGYGDGRTGADAGCLENSPEELARYRAMYLQFMEQCLTKDEESKGFFSKSTLNSISSHGSAKITRRSIVIENLQIAADDPVCTIEIVNKIFDEVARLFHEPHQIPSQGDPQVEHGDEISINSDNSTGELKDDFYLYEVACAVADEELDQRRMRWLRNGFKALC